MKTITKNWKTTVAGVCAILTAIASAVTALVDGDPSTNMDIAATIAAVMAGVGLIAAKDGTTK